MKWHNLSTVSFGNVGAIINVINTTGPRTPTKLAEACVRLNAFRQHYNTERPHRQLGYLTPLVFKAARLEAQAKVQDS